MTQAADVEAAAISSGTSEANPTQFDFFRLPRAIQDRFLASVKGTGAPRPVLFEPASPASGYGWLGLFAVMASVVLTLAVVGYGDLKSSLALQSQLLTPVYGVCAGLSALALAGYAWSRTAHARYPYRLGVYFFPVGVVVAKGEHLRLHRLTDLLQVQFGGGRVRMKFQEGTFSFAIPRSLSEEQLQASLDEYTAKLKEALARKDRRALAALDPIRDSGFSNPLSSAAAITRTRDQRVWRYGLALILGATIGVLLLLARNKLGERVLYQKAVAANTADAYKDYLARGGSRPDVTEVLLPRAQLQLLKGDTAALTRYAQENPDSKIRTEVELSLREALLRELEEVHKAGTLAAIAQFQAAQPLHTVISAELAQARSRVFATALQNYRAKPASNERVRELFEHLIGYSEKHGPQVEVRYRRNVPTSVERSDSAIRRSAYYGGKSSLPSQYFTKEYSEPREKVAAAELIGSLQKHFSPEILQFVVGEPLEGEGDLPSVQRPTLFISYTTDMSGGYTTNRPRGVFVGLGLRILAEFVVPDSDLSYRLRFSLWMPPDINEISRDNLKPEQVYEKNARHGFERFNAKLLDELTPAP